jgi:hypothetical protein
MSGSHDCQDGADGSLFPSAVVLPLFPESEEEFGISAMLLAAAGTALLCLKHRFAYHVGLWRPPRFTKTSSERDAESHPLDFCGD